MRISGVRFRFVIVGVLVGLGVFAAARFTPPALAEPPPPRYPDQPRNQEKSETVPHADDSLARRLTELRAFVDDLSPPTVEEIIESMQPIPSLEACLGPPPDDPDAPYRRVLTGAAEERLRELGKQAMQLRASDGYAEMIPLCEEAERICALHLGANHWRTIDTRRDRRMCASLAALSPQALDEVLQADAKDKHSVILFLAWQGEYDEALRLGLQHLAVYRRHLGDAHPWVATALVNLALVQHERGEPMESELLVRAAWVLYRHNDYDCGPEHELLAVCLVDLAVYAQEQGELTSAELLNRASLAMFHRLLGEEHQRMLTATIKMVTVMIDQGKALKAELLASRALGSTKRLLGEQHPRVLECLSALANAIRDQGRLAEAEVIHRELLASSRSAHGDEHPYVATDIDGLADCLHQQGRLEEAEALYRQALRIREGRLSSEHPRIALSFNNIARALREQGKLQEAEQLQRKALKLQREKWSNGRHPDIATSLSNLALTLQAQGKLQEAEQLQRDALALCEGLFGDSHPRTLMTASSLAETLGRQGCSAEAIALQEKAVAETRNVLGEKHPLLLSALVRLGESLWESGDCARAESTFAAAAEVFEAARLQVSTTGLGRSAYAARHSPLCRLAVLRARGGRPLAAWQSLERNLARGLLDTLTARNLLPLTAVEQEREAVLLAKLAALDEKLSLVLEASSSGPESLTLQSEIRRLRQARTALEAELGRFAWSMREKYGVRAGQVYELARTQAQLDADTALLAWTDLAPASQGVGDGGEHWVCVVRHERDPRWIRLPGTGSGGLWTRADDSLPSQVRGALSSRATTSSEEWELIAKRLYAQRIAPIEPHLDGVRHLIVVPVGRMAGVPIEALTSQYAVSYAPSGTVYAWLREQRPIATARSSDLRCGPLLALGNPKLTRFGEPQVALASPPEYGVFITTVTPNSNAQRSGIVASDVLLTYGSVELRHPDDLKRAITQASHAEATHGGGGIRVTLWREGRTVELAVGQRYNRISLMAGRKKAAYSRDLKTKVPSRPRWAEEYAGVGE